MKLEISTKAVFHFELLTAEVAVLTLLSQRHYDSVCKAASQIGGFIYGWKNYVEFNGGCNKVSASWRDLDTTLKIVEQAELYFRNNTLTEAQMFMVYKLRRGFKAAMDKYNEMYKTWETEVTVDDPQTARS